MVFNREEYFKPAIELARKTVANAEGETYDAIYYFIGYDFDPTNPDHVEIVSDMILNKIATVQRFGYYGGRTEEKHLLYKDTENAPEHVKENVARRKHLEEEHGMTSTYMPGGEFTPLLEFMFQMQTDWEKAEWRERCEEISERDRRNERNSMIAFYVFVAIMIIFPLIILLSE